MRSVGVLSLVAICCATTAQAQNDRPSVVTLGRGSIGGYVEGNTSSFPTGRGQRFATELQRFNLFFAAPIGQHFEFASELALTQGANAVAVEAAHLDFLLHPQMTLRGGILRPPVGTYNVNRDSPHWEFVDRPLVSTDIISTSNSELGLGAHGTVARGDLTLSYDAYVTSGLPSSFVVSATRPGQHVFGSPSLSGRVALRERLGEVGVSFYTGRDKAYTVAGDVIEDPRHRMLVAADFATGTRGISVRGGMAYSKVSIQPSMKDVFADRQWGAHLDIIVPILRPAIGGLENAVVNASLRLERIDYNRMNFNSAARNVFEDLNAVVAGLSFRPTQRTVVRANYRWHWFHDVLGNPVSRKAGLQLGFATYF